MKGLPGQVFRTAGNMVETLADPSFFWEKEALHTWFRRKKKQKTARITGANTESLLLLIQNGSNRCLLSDDEKKLGIVVDVVIHTRDNR